MSNEIVEIMSRVNRSPERIDHIRRAVLRLCMISLRKSNLALGNIGKVKGNKNSSFTTY
jgi:hypothetical protein